MEFYKDKNTLVLGGAGFIGSQITHRLLQAGARVCVVDGFMPETGADASHLPEVHEKLTLHKSPIEELKNLDSLVSESDLIIDSMALTAHHIGMDRPEYDLALNTNSHLKLLEALKEVGTDKNIILLGSRGQYGRVQGNSVSEDTPQIPVDAQGISKAATESYFRVYSKHYGFNATSLRITNCYGPHQKLKGQDLGLVGGFVKDLLDNKTIEIYGGRQRQKNLLYVDDLVSVVLAVGENLKEGFHAYNVAGEDIVLVDLVEQLIAKIGQGQLELKEFPEDIRRMDVGEAQFSEKKLTEWLTPLQKTSLQQTSLQKTPLDKSLRETVQYFKAGL